jgi:predicted outer membrane repeat protein
MLGLLISAQALAAATITVGPSSADYTTIGQAIQAASDGDTIQVSAGSKAYAENLDLGGKTLHLETTDGAELEPTSGDVITWDEGEGGSFSGFTVIVPSGGTGLVLEDASVEISDLEIEGGGDSSALGGAVSIDGGSPSFESIEIDAPTAKKGGAFYITGGATVTLELVDIVDSSATWGGAMHVSDSTLTAESVTISDPYALRHAGAIYLDNSTASFTDLEIEDPTGDSTWGGAFYLMDHSQLSIDTGEISGCSIASTGFGGGAIYAEQGSHVDLQSLTIEDCSAYEGGAIGLDASTGTLVEVDFDGNSADEDGGALSLGSSSSVTCEECSFSSNEAGADGGAVYVDASSSFEDVDGVYSGNSAVGGGAVYLASEASFSGCSFDGNSAEEGGAIFADDIDGGLTLSDCSFSSNSATTGDGGAVLLDRQASLSADALDFSNNVSTLGAGGAIAFSPGSSAWDLSVSDSSFDGNEATGDGGAVYVDSGDSITLRACELLDNVSSASGGGLFVRDVEEVSVTRSLFYANVASDEGGGALEQASSDAGTWTNNRFVENEADAGGGLALIDCADDTYVVNNSFVGNSADSDGGHLYVDGGSLEFINNLGGLAQDGGAVYGDSTAADSGDFYYNAMWSNTGSGSSGSSDYGGELSDPAGTDGNLTDDPDLVAYTLDGDESDDDLHLGTGSVAIDVGHPAIVDPDGSPSDLGAYGGPDALWSDEDEDGWYDTSDCDDSDPDIHPGAEEVAYDGIDQDCDGQDLVDVDEDGFEGGSSGDDCDDEDATVNPDATEIYYDGVDQDCDGLSDYDADLDGYDADVWGGSDCDDSDAAVNPLAGEVWYDGVDQDCDRWSDYDADYDGFESDLYGGLDCDDTKAWVSPLATETPYDGVDQDCDGADIWDVDGDGWDGGPGGFDCDDGDPAIHPAQVEIPYNDVDENCDGLISWDADNDTYDLVSRMQGALVDCDDTDASINPGMDEIWYDGVDQNCDGLDDYDQDQDGWHVDEDCDDTDPLTYPAAWDVPYDGVDRDCMGDDDFDVDGDGYRSAAHGGGEDCDDFNDTVFPGGVELYDGLDNDCDGYTERADRDGDGAIDWDEWQAGSDYLDPDTDDDGLQDGRELLDGGLTFDTDLDGVADVFDTDDDGDGIPSATENLADPHRDGHVSLDVDGDGLLNCRDRDSDGDGYLDEDEGLEDRDFDKVPDYIDYTGDFAGGGCAGGGVTWLGALVLPLLFVRRRESVWLAVAALLSVGLVSSPARAAGVDAHGFQLMGTTGDLYGYTRMAYPYGGVKGDFDVSLVADHAWRPLVEVLPEGRQVVLSNLSTASVAMSGSLGSWTRLEAVLPVHLYGVGPTGSFAAMGDLRLGAVVPAWSPAGTRPGLAIAPSVWVPTGNEERMVGNPGFSGGGVITVAQELGRLGWVVNVGARAGRFEPERNLRAGAGPLVGLGLHYAVTNSLTVTGEAATQGTSGFSQWPLELMLSSRIRLRGGSWAMVGAGAGLNDAVGSSTARVVIGGGFNRRREAPPEVIVQYVEPPIDTTADRDGDGIVDVEDACPDQAETYDGFDDDDGCPELDGDNDGVPFDRDACPEEPIYPEQDPRYSDGCPKLAELSGDRIVITQNIFFREGSAVVLRRSGPVLDEVARIIVEHPELDTVLIEGHTNNNGGPEYNYRLSEDRAVSVMRWLIDAGVDRNRLVAQGYGYDVPLVDHDHRDAKKLNRRVEFTVMERQESHGDNRLPQSDELPD